MLEYINVDKISPSMRGEIGLFFFEVESILKRELIKETYADLALIFHLNISQREKDEDQYVVKSNEKPELKGSFAFTTFTKQWLCYEITQSFLAKYPNLSFSFNLAFALKTDKKANEIPEQYTPITPKYAFQKVILQENVKSEIMEALCIIENNELVYQKWGFEEVEATPRSVINFYGPPGTGKTMCAHAIAHRLGYPFLVLNYAQIESKYVGDAAKNMMNAFETAKRYGAILFFDEADSFLGKRIENVSQGSDQALNSLRSQTLMLLEEFEGVVIFATNLVTNFDKAFESRILKHIKFELPNREARAAIIQNKIPKKLPFTVKPTSDDYLELSDIVDGFSGREIKNAVLETIIKKATDCGEQAIFTVEDLKLGFTKKKESLAKLKEEQERSRKDKIIKALGGTDANNKGDADEKKDEEAKPKSDSEEKND